MTCTAHIQSYLILLLDSSYSTSRTGPYVPCVSYYNSQTLDTNAVNIVIDTNDGITFAFGFDIKCVAQTTTSTTCSSGCAFVTINDDNYVCPTCSGNSYNGGSCTCSDGMGALLQLNLCSVYTTPQVHNALYAQCLLQLQVAWLQPLVGLRQPAQALALPQVAQAQVTKIIMHTFSKVLCIYV